MADQNGTKQGPVEQQVEEKIRQEEARAMVASKYWTCNGCGGLVLKGRKCPDCGEHDCCE